MNKTLTATYESEDTLKNVEEELVGFASIPKEQIFVDKENKLIKVIIPTATEDEVRRIFQSHHPKKMAERTWTEQPPPPPAASPPPTETTAKE